MDTSTPRTWPKAALAVLLLAGGCSDPEADQREQICRIWKVSKREIPECRRSEEAFNAVLRPREIERFMRVAASFNADLATLAPPMSTVLDRVYAPVELTELASKIGYVSIVSKEEVTQKGTAL